MSVTNKGMEIIGLATVTPTRGETMQTTNHTATHTDVLDATITQVPPANIRLTDILRQQYSPADKVEATAIVVTIDSGGRIRAIQNLN